MSSSEVAIIGAGLSGLTLALALHQQGITSTVYESRPGPLNIGGAVMLSPNALRITDALGFYSTIQSHGYNFELLDFATPTGTLLDTYEFGSVAKYGYAANRIYRHELIDAVLAQIHALGIRVEFGRKFSHVLHETADAVTFAFADGTQHTATLLVGADGIHSTVRKYKHLHPTLEPRYTHMAGITAAVPTAQLQLSTPLTRPLTIMDPQHGAFVVAPQKVDGSEVLIGKQRRLAGAEPTRDEWAAVHADKAASVAFLQQDAAVFGELAVHATTHIQHDRINVWPFYVIPKLERWMSSGYGRVVILGDAAHAIPPSAGQGINQAFEDVYVLALLLGACRRSPGAGEGNTVEIPVADALAFWQRYRQERVERVLELNTQIDARRAPTGDESSRELAGKHFELEWLYNVDFEAVVQDWVAGQLGRAG